MDAITISYIPSFDLYMHKRFDSFSQKVFLSVLTLFLLTTSCNFPSAQTPAPVGTILPGGLETSTPLPTNTFIQETPTVLIPVTGMDVVSLQCQFCVNDETHALLIMPERASFLVSDPVMGINCLTAKVVNGQRIVLCRGGKQTSFTLNVCVENSNCLQLPVTLQSCPLNAQAGIGTAVATFSALTSTPTVIDTPIPATLPVDTSTPVPPQVPPTLLPASTSTSIPTQTVVAPPAAPTSASRSQPTRVSASGTRVPQLPATTLTVPALEDPVEFVRWYFEQVWQVRDYQNLWDNYLTPSFRSHASGGSYEEYTRWWDAVERVDVNSANVIQSDGAHAWVRVNITFTMKDGRVISNQEYDYELSYDPARQTWVFDYRS